jgi:hypothetical protein
MNTNQNTSQNAHPSLEPLYQNDIKKYESQVIEALKKDYFLHNYDVHSTNSGDDSILLLKFTKVDSVYDFIVELQGNVFAFDLKKIEKESGSYLGCFND